MFKLERSFFLGAYLRYCSITGNGTDVPESGWGLFGPAPPPPPEIDYAFKASCFGGGLVIGGRLKVFDHLTLILSMGAGYRTGKEVIT